MKQFLLLLSLLAFLFSCSTSSRSELYDPDKLQAERDLEDTEQSLDLTIRIKKNAGVRVQGNGATAKIYIRGINSFSNLQSPLFIVDGRQMTEYSDVYHFIDPNDIVRIEVLKRTDQLASYGFRGVNGVIKITTKHN
ncbi:MAG: TonB-dependent receptor plug domain-containing protein [Bacteroidia bacterium]|nr:TonB-dependent receptor plug domain-containing protein [Bacteroidia bacterium]